MKETHCSNSFRVGIWCDTTLSVDDDLVLYNTAVLADDGLVPKWDSRGCVLGKYTESRWLSVYLGVDADSTVG